MLTTIINLLGIANTLSTAHQNVVFIYLKKKYLLYTAKGLLESDVIEPAFNDSDYHFIQKQKEKQS